MQKYLLASLKIASETTCYLYPQYEYDQEGKIFPIENKWAEFPDRGTIYMPKKENENLSKYLNKLVKVLFDTENVAQNYDANFFLTNRCKYVAKTSDIEMLSKDELIEIITIENKSIQELISNKQSRILVLDSLPLNNKIIIRIDEFCYGPFNYVQEDSETKIKIRIEPDDYMILKYNYQDIEPYVCDAQVTSNATDPKKNFIENLSILEEEIRLLEKIDYFDNEMLLQECLKVLTEARAIENVSDNAISVLRDLKGVLENHPDLCEQNALLSPERIAKLEEVVDRFEILEEYKQQFVEEFFRSGKISEEEKLLYLQQNPAVLQDVIAQTADYQRTLDELQGKLAKGEQELIELTNQKDEVEKEIINLQENAEEYRNKTLRTIQEDLDRLNNENAEARREKERIDGEIEIAKRTKNNLIRESNDLNIEIEGKITKWLEQKRDNEIIAFLVSEFGKYKEPESKQWNEKYNIRTYDSGMAIIDKICLYFERANRFVTKDEIINYLITIAGNFITVFAGQPGTGKTSTCNLLAKAMGIYDDRYAEISVGKGWTSSRDLIGYYNSLTQTFEETQPKFTRCLDVLTREAEGQKANAPYLVLLDEANLSQVEHYWADFNQISDDFDGRTILVSNCKRYRITDELRFVATINYDHTTEILSPRFLDRAWIIRMEGIDVSGMLSGELQEEISTNSSEMVSQSDIIRFFTTSGKEMQGKQMSPYTIGVLKKFVECFIRNGHSISYRSVSSMKEYCIVAESYMTDKTCALDWAIAQKLLPQINGSGSQYLNFLETIFTMCQENHLQKSEKIISKIKEVGVREHNYFNYFNV